jgi:hypothetical protein
MSHEEQQKLRTKYHSEAIRYMDNAKETLRKAGKQDKLYQEKNM